MSADDLAFAEVQFDEAKEMDRDRSLGDDIYARLSERRREDVGGYELKRHHHRGRPRSSLTHSADLSPRFLFATLLSV